MFDQLKNWKISSNRKPLIIYGARQVGKTWLITASDSAKTLKCFNSIPAQLAKENHKFQYKVVQRGGSASLFGASIDWLAAAGIITKCNKIEHGLMPPVQLFYWESDSKAEIDFIIQDYDKEIPIEVKANHQVKSRSLSVYVQKYKPDYSIRISAKKFGFENNIKSVPLYAVFCIQPKKPLL